MTANNWRCLVILCREQKMTSFEVPEKHPSLTQLEKMTYQEGLHVCCNSSRRCLSVLDLGGNQIGAKGAGTMLECCRSAQRCLT